MRKALTLIVAAMLLATCTACANDGTSDEPSSQCTDTGNGVTVCEVPQPNGGTVTCVRTNGQDGGISCDWDD